MSRLDHLVYGCGFHVKGSCSCSSVKDIERKHLPNPKLHDKAVSVCFSLVLLVSSATCLGYCSLSPSVIISFLQRPDEGT